MACLPSMHALLRALGTGLRHDGVVDLRRWYATSTGGVDIAYQLAGPGRMGLAPSSCPASSRIWIWVGLRTDDESASGWSCPRVECSYSTSAAQASSLNATWRRQLLPSAATTSAPVMDAAGWEHAHLIGISEGGPMSILFAATYSRSRALSPVAVWAPRRAFLVAPDYPFGFAGDAGAAAARNREALGFGATCWRRYSSRGAISPPGFMARLERNACTPKAAHALMRRNFDIDVRELLPVFACPDPSLCTSPAILPCTSNSA